MTVSPNQRSIGLRPCVFFDRDGIVNQSPGPGYVERVADFHLLPEFPPALSVARRKGYAAVLITNQRGVGKGVMTQATLDAIHTFMKDELARHGLALDAVYACSELDRTHPRLKPQPGMLLEAALDLGLDLARSWMVGDNEKDVQAGKAAGCRTILVREGREPTVADYRLSRMADLAGFLEEHLV
jgi:D-glycero-D-manno-heptose 1,7-bisphosphate phosphatase